MKRAKKILLVASLVLISVIWMDAYAQGRSNERGHGKGNAHGHYNKNKTSKRDDHGKHDHRGSDYHDRTGHQGHNHRVRHYRHEHATRVVSPVYTHQHRHDCGHRIVVRHYDTPRYVYYSDYDVYYDYHRNVYISFTGRNWTVSASLPVVLHRVDIRRAHRMEVNYYDDDFIGYLGHGRPMYGNIYVSR